MVEVVSIFNQAFQVEPLSHASDRSLQVTPMLVRSFLGPVAFLLLIAGVCGCAPATVSDREREIVLTADELLAFGFEPPTGAINETWDGWRWFDGSKEIEYTYETQSESERMPLYLSVTLGWEATQSDAVASYGATLLGFKIGSVSESIERRQLADSCNYGDKCELYLLSHDEQPLGNQFVARVGRVVYTVQLFGLYFDEPELWHEVIFPKMDALRQLGKKRRDPGEQV